MKDEVGDRQKFFEKNYGLGRYLIKDIPAICRLDGKAFSSFTRGLTRPFDENFGSLMIATTKFLVSETCCRWAYVQSDEISLCWLTSGDTQMYFDGKVQKIVSVTAGLASAFFNRKLDEYLPAKLGALPVFDSRVFSLPNETETVSYLGWRQSDASRNSINSLAQNHFSNNSLKNKSLSEVHEMLYAVGINWADQPFHFKNGTFVRRIQKEKTYEVNELEWLPEAHAARLNPDLKVLRNVIEEIELPHVNKLANANDVLFRGETPRKVSETNDPG